MRVIYMKPKIKTKNLILEKKNQKSFINEVTQYALDSIVDSTDEESLLKILDHVILSEKRKCKYAPYSFDPSDDKEFWSKIEFRITKVKNQTLNSFLKSTSDKEVDAGAKQETISSKNFRHDYIKKIIYDIIYRYVSEIYTPLSPYKFKLLKRIAGFLIKHIIYKPFGLFRKINIFDYVNISGNLNIINKLIPHATFVLVPNHSSHFDSIMAGTGIEYLNNIYNSNLKMPIYGAGFNLYEHIIFKYWISKCGIYCIDRRKKNKIYLDTLKTYYKALMMRGYTSLFYPGGTRSRDGSLEESLKYGLLSVPIKTQKFSYKIHGPKAKKIVILPVTISYESVFEATSLVEDFIGNKKYIKAKIFDRLKQIFYTIKNGSHVKIALGNPMDVLGNFVDSSGISYDDNGKIINLHDRLIVNKIDNDNKNLSKSCNINSKLQNTEILKVLENRILEEYKKDKYIFPSIIIAKAAFNLIKIRYAKFDEEEFWDIDAKEIKLPIKDILKEVTIIFYKLKNLKISPTIDKKIYDIAKISKSITDSDETCYHYSDFIDEIESIIEGLGAFNIERPLYFVKPNFLQTDSIKLLYYYANSLKNYGV